MRDSAEQNTKSSSRANDYPEQGAGLQHHFANEHQQTGEFKLEHCPECSVYSGAIAVGDSLANKGNDCLAGATH